MTLDEHREKFEKVIDELADEYNIGNCQMQYQDFRDAMEQLFNVLNTQAFVRKENHGKGKM